jgi:ATP-dependent Clp protease adaptor protein ClpS
MEEEKDKPGEVREKKKVPRKKPAREIPLCRVVMHDDKATPLEFVLRVLRQVFLKDQVDAARIAIEAESKQRAVAAELHFELAEHRVSRAHAFARQEGHPLLFTIER